MTTGGSGTQDAPGRAEGKPIKLPGAWETRRGASGRPRGAHTIGPLQPALVDSGSVQGPSNFLRLRASAKVQKKKHRNFDWGR